MKKGTWALCGTKGHRAFLSVLTGQALREQVKRCGCVPSKNKAARALPPPWPVRPTDRPTPDADA